MESMKANKVAGQPTRSKDMPPWQKFWGPVFYQNQFKTTIELPNKGTWPSAKGKCAIVTGSSSGLGLEAAAQLLDLGLSHLVIAARSLERGRLAASRLEKKHRSAKIDVFELEMESYESIQVFAQRCKDELPRIDYVILNAGVSPLNFATSKGSGHERAVQVNHLGTAYLAVLLLPILKSKSSGARPPILATVSSVMAHLSSFTNRDKRPLLPSFDDTKITPYESGDRYGASKLLSQLFFSKLADKVDSGDVTILMIEPGLVKGTGLHRDGKGLSGALAGLFFGIAGRRVEHGAATYVDAVLRHDQSAHGCYLMNCKVAPYVPRPL